MTPLIRSLALAAAKEAGVSANDMFLKRAARCHARPRFAVMKVAREHGRPYALVARHLNLRNHTSIIHGVRRADELERIDPVFAALLGNLRALAEARP